MPVNEAVAMARPVLQALSSLLAFIKRKPKPRLVFVEQPGSTWNYMEQAIGIQLYAHFHVTNDGNAACRPSRIQVRRTGLAHLIYKDPWQDCTVVDVDGTRLDRFSIGPLLEPDDTVVMRIFHIHKSPKPEASHPANFRLRVCDERKRFYSARLLASPAPILGRQE